MAKKRQQQTVVEVEAVTTESLFDRVWKGLPSVQAALPSLDFAATTSSHGGAPLDAGEIPDVQISISEEEMTQLVGCVYRALHRNATDEDVAETVRGILSVDNDSTSDDAATYHKNDVTDFLQSVPDRWLSELRYSMRDANGGASRLGLEFYKELIDCILSDEPPNLLLPTNEALMMQRVYRAANIVDPVTDFVPLLPPALNPPIYDDLWRRLQLDERAFTALTLQQFRLFFVWFHQLHFSNTTTARADAAADVLFRKYQDAQGSFPITQFQRACEEMCAVYAQRRDAEVYLAELVQKATAACYSSGDGDAVTPRVAADFFLHAGDVAMSPPRRVLYNPVELFLSDELRVLQQEVGFYHNYQSQRVVVIGPSFIGKSDVGRELAKKLNSVHLDVLELVVAAVTKKPLDEVGTALQSCIDAHQPISIGLQAKLIEQALSSNHVRYHGYVFSDTVGAITTGSRSPELLLDRFLKPSGIFTLQQPNIFVELTTAVASAYEEYASLRRRIATSAAEAAAAQFNERAEKRRRAAEKEEMRASCNAILARLVTLEAAAPGTTSEEELMLARQQATEAQEIMTALDEEEKEEKEEAGGVAEAEAEVEEDAEKEDGAVPVAEAQETEATLHRRIAALIHDGRVEAGLADSSSAGSDDVNAVVPLHGQDWLSCWRRTAEQVSLQRHSVSVDALASLSTEEVVSYITESLQLTPCHVAAALPEADEGTDEERSRAMEEAAQENGYEPSPVWKRYCPVTYAEDGVLVEGAMCYGCTYRSTVYCTASPEKRQRLMENPLRYLSDKPTDRRALVLLADEKLCGSSTINYNLGLVAEQLARELKLTPYTVSQFYELLEERRIRSSAREVVSETRKVAEEEARRARRERQEQLAKSKSKRKGGSKMSKTSSKKSLKSSSKVSVADAEASATNLTLPSLSGRRRMPRATVRDGPLAMADEIEMRIADAKARLEKDPPFLLTGLTVEDLNSEMMRKLRKEHLLPESVLVLRPAAMPQGEDEVDVDEAPEADAEVGEPADVANDGGAPAGEEATDVVDGAAARNSTSQAGTFAIDPVITMLSEKPASEWRSAMAGGVVEEPRVHSIHTVSLLPDLQTDEVIKEVLQRIFPGAPQATEGTVDEALGDEDEEEEEEEMLSMGSEDEEGKNSFLREAPKEPPNPLLRPMKRYIHQFGTRLNYCPVTLKQKGILVRGRVEYCLHYVDGLYTFASEEYRNAFEQCPERYVGALPSQDTPPRIWIVGVPHAGKKSLAAGLQEEYRVPFFVYDRQFFEDCIEAAKGEGGLVRGVYIPRDDIETNPHLKRASELLDELRKKAEEEEVNMKAKEDAGKQLEERERLMEEREARSGDDESSEDEEDAWTEEMEEALQLKLEFEPEDEEDKRVRLSETYLRMASCVARLQPFEKQGYIMICPPFSEGDLDVLFDEGGIPEVVVRLGLPADVFAQRSATIINRLQEIKNDGNAELATQVAVAVEQSQKEALLLRQRERAVRKWRRRHIGVNDPPSDDDNDDAAADDGAERRRASDGADPITSSSAPLPPAVSAPATLEEDEEARIMLEDALEEFIEAVEERQVEVIQVDASAAVETVRRLVIDRLGRHLHTRASLFYVPEVLWHEDAMNLLQSGRCDLSCFAFGDSVRIYEWRENGRRTECVWKPSGIRVGPELDPVEVIDSMNSHGSDDEPEEQKEPEEPELMSDVASEDLDELREVVERKKRLAKRQRAPRVARLLHRLYFFENDENLLKFLLNPWPFITQAPPPPQMMQQAVVAIYEDDDRCSHEVDGVKLRSLAESAAYNLRAVPITTSSLLSWGAVHPRLGALRAQSFLAAQQGLVSDELLHTLLTLRLSSAEVKQRGAVLQNLPRGQFSAEGLASTKIVAPIVKVAQVKPRVSTTDADIAAYAAWQEVVKITIEALSRYALVTLPLPRPSGPLDDTNLVAIVHAVESWTLQARDGLLREDLAFPIELFRSYQVNSVLQRHLSDYGVYCPYEWMEQSDLVVTTTIPVENLELATKYIGKYYFLSQPVYLQRFMRDPAFVADPTTLKPLPPALPRIVDVEKEVVEETALELEGCCPVLLFDTASRRGLRGIIEPTARKGSLSCIVFYDGRYYSLRNEENKARFLRRPWMYVDGAHLPGVLKRPLPRPMMPCDIKDDEEYIRRQLNDPVAYALLAVARERPIYPGLSPEESALKFIALFLKAQHDESHTEIQQRHYHQTYELFSKRATLYHSAYDVKSSGTPSRAAVLDGEKFCAAYEDAVEEGSSLHRLIHLQDPTKTDTNPLAGPTDGLR